MAVWGCFICGKHFGTRRKDKFWMKLWDERESHMEEEKF